MAFEPSKDFDPVYNLILQNCVSIITYVCIIINAYCHGHCKHDMDDFIWKHIFQQVD